MNATKCYSTTVLWNVILTTAQSYGTIVLCETHLRLKNCRKKALSYVTLDVNTTYDQLLTKCEKTPLYVTRIYTNFEMLYQILHHLCPSYLYSFVKNNTSSYNIRSELNMIIPKFNTFTYGKNSMKYTGPFYWNMLPNNVKRAESFKIFKKLLKTWRPRCSCGSCVLCKVFNIW